MSGKDKIPQTIQSLIGSIGEGLVVFKLFELVYCKPDFEVFKNFSEPGYDCGIRNVRTGSKVRVEVKTRQRLITASNDVNIAHFMLTENEHIHADFMIGYWLEYNDFFIVPVVELNQVKSGKRWVYKLIVRITKNGNYDQRSLRYRNRWDLISNFFK